MEVLIFWIALLITGKLIGAALEGQYCTDTAHRLDDLITDLENLRDIAHNEEIEEEEL
jgi:hypothetical protein